MSISSPPLTPSSKEAILFAPNLALVDSTASNADLSKAKVWSQELPLPPLPQQEPSNSASSTLLGAGASALSLLGDAVTRLGSAAASALSSIPSDADAFPAKAGASSSVTPKDAQLVAVASLPPYESMLGSISSVVLGHAASMRDAAFVAVTETACSLASTALHAITDTATGIATSTLTLANPGSETAAANSPARDTEHEHTYDQPHSQIDERQLRRASTLPVQYTATGEPFSTDPSISAMQRIPDHPCGHVHTVRTPLTHCCSAPDSLTTLQEIECTCTCFAVDSPAEDQTVQSEQQPGHGKMHECRCICHTTTAYRKGQSGHFHRVQQLVKGTKRVVRDIKNVL